MTVSLSPELLERVDQLAGGPSRRPKFFKKLLVHRLAMGSVRRDPGTGGSLQVYVRLTPKELADIDRAASAAGMARSEWIVALIRRHISAKPQFARADRLLLVEAHRELHRIAVSMCSVSSHLSDCRVGSGDFAEQAAQLIEASIEVERQMRALREAFEGNFIYWETPNA